MSPSISVRPARAEDKPAVISFCQNTFSWGDYIGEVYDDWLGDPNGRLVVGLVDDRPVALIHVALLNDRIGWLEGMRVHPDYRRLGLGSAVDTAGRAFARERGRVVARLATSIKNLAAQRTVEGLGYKLLTRTDNWEAPSSGDVGDPDMPFATMKDAPRILDLWQQSPLRTASAGVLQDPDWRWTELTPERVHEHIRNNQIRFLPAGFGILRTISRSDGSSELHVEAFVGDPDTIRTLALAARAESARQGIATLEAMVANDDHLAGILSSAGYIREGAMLIYETAL